MGRVIGLDWGTSALRAWLMEADGTAVDRRARDWGILSLPEGGFVGAFSAVTAGWGEWPAVACGMVGSRQGWVEAGYLAAPADLAGLAGSLTRVELGGGRDLWVVPGVSVLTEGRADVMRGEETQALGALPMLEGVGGACGTEGRAVTLVMPGTHSKWVRVMDGRVVGFRTFMTGELYAVLMRHSILGRGVPEGAGWSGEAFARGVRAGASGGATASLFSARATVLLGGLEAWEVPSFLSGVLIGDEVGRGTAGGAAAEGVVLVGESLSAHYGEAFSVLGRGAPAVLRETALAGLGAIARAAGLVEG